MRRFEVGVQLHPQRTSYDELRAAWQRLDDLGVDSLWTWDHFFPIYGEGEGDHLEGWTLLTAAAVVTTRPRLGVLVSSIGYRNPDLLADMARTADHVSGGRVILGVGAGWFQRDYDEYGFAFGTAAARLRALEDGLVRIRRRLELLRPAPVGDLPILVGGGGEKVTLRLVAEHADLWNGFGPPDEYARKSRVLDEWCERVGRDPAEVGRTAMLHLRDVPDAERFVAAGARHLIVGLGAPFDLAPVERLLELAGD